VQPASRWRATRSRGARAAGVITARPRAPTSAIERDCVLRRAQQSRQPAGRSGAARRIARPLRARRRSGARECGSARTTSVRCCWRPATPRPRSRICARPRASGHLSRRTSNLRARLRRARQFDDAFARRQSRGAGWRRVEAELVAQIREQLRLYVQEPSVSGKFRHCLILTAHLRAHRARRNGDVLADRCVRLLVMAPPSASCHTGGRDVCLSADSVEKIVV